MTNTVLYPKISIVTPSYNQGQFIEETIRSILDQNYPNLEYIIIDGGSTDHTVEIIKKYEDKISYWISEQDRGQAHAINKGFERASGEIFAYLNSDDCYYANTLHLIAKAYLNNNDNSNLLFIGNCFWGETQDDPKGFLDVPHFPNSLEKALYRNGLAPQASMFWTKKAIDVKFYEQLQFCMDHEFWLQLILNNYEVVRIDETLSFFRQHESAKTHTITHILEQELNGVRSIYVKHLSAVEQIKLRLFNLKSENHKVARDLLIAHQKKEVKFIELLKSDLSFLLKCKTLYNALFGIRSKINDPRPF